MERRFPRRHHQAETGFSLDTDAIRVGLERLIANGVSGVVMMGMVGENAQLAPEES